MIEPGVHQGGAQLKPRMGETHVTAHDLLVDRSFCQQVVGRAVKSVADNCLKTTVGGITIEHFIGIKSSKFRFSQFESGTATPEKIGFGGRAVLFQTSRTGRYI